MQIKFYIAIFFVAVFFGKLITDSKLLGVIFDSDKIAFVNPFCEKYELSKEDALSFAETSKSNKITVNVICASAFQFEIDNYLLYVSRPNYQKQSFRTQSIVSNYRDKFYQPPKV